MTRREEILSNPLFPGGKGCARIFIDVTCVLVGRRRKSIIVGRRFDEQELRRMTLKREDDKIESTVQQVAKLSAWEEQIEGQNDHRLSRTLELIEMTVIRGSGLASLGVS